MIEPNIPCIYRIVCPDTLAVVYVGMTLDPRVRFRAHLSSNRSPIGKWISALLKKDKKPIFEKIITFDVTEFENDEQLKWHMKYMEEEWLMYYYEKQGRLLNKIGYFPIRAVGHYKKQSA